MELPRLTLTWKFVAAIFIVAAATAVTIGVIASSTVRTVSEQEITQQLAVEASHRMDKLHSFFADRVSDVETLAELPVLQSDTASIAEKARVLNVFQNRSQLYSRIELYHATGLKVADTNGFRQDNPSSFNGSAEELHDMFHANEADEHAILHTPFHQATHYDPRPVHVDYSDTPVIRFSAPIFGENGLLNGIVVIHLPVETFQTVVSSTGFGQEQTEIDVDLVDREGLLLFSNHQEENVLNADLSHLEIFELTRKSPRTVEVVRQRTAQDNDLFVGVKDTSRLRGYIGQGWIMILRVPAEVAFQSVRTVENRILIATILLVLVSAGAAFFAARPITKRIKGLTAIIEQISVGNLQVDIPEELKQSSDELGQLARAFSRVMVSLKLAMKNAGANPGESDET